MPLVSDLRKRRCDIWMFLSFVEFFLDFLKGERVNEKIGIIKEIKRRKKEGRFLVWKAFKRRKGYFFGEDE